MKKGNLVIYDSEGKIWMQTGEAEGNILPHIYPTGLPYMEIPFGTMATKRLLYVDTSKEVHVPVFEDIQIMQSETEKIEELEAQLLIAKGVI